MNVSKQNDDDGISMYLSFESTTAYSETDSLTSRTKYETITGDTSFSLTGLIDTTGDSTKCNTTLHCTEKVHELSAIMKDCLSVTTSADKAAAAADTDAPPFPQRLTYSRILKEFNAMSSTPSKLPANPSVPTNAAAKIISNNSTQNVGGMSDVSVAFRNLLAADQTPENKENNLLPTASTDDSMPSFSQTSLLKLQQKKNLSANETKPKDTEKICQEPEKSNATASLPKAKSAINTANTMQKGSDFESSKQYTASTIALLKRSSILYAAKKELHQHKANVENALKTITEANEKPTAHLIPKLTGNQNVKMNSAAVRKTICEPNLLLQRPARILPSKKTRATLLPNEQRPYGDGNFATMPSSSSTVTQNGRSDDMPTELTQTDSYISFKRPAASSRRSVAGGGVGMGPITRNINNNNRRTVFINLQNEVKQQQRPTPNKRQMLPIVKTTLNSATRKATRPSLTGVGGNALGKRRSVLLLQSKLMQPPLNAQKPRRTLHSAPSSSNEDERSAKNSTNRRTTLYQSETSNVNNKYCCTTCGATYKIKSLLEAHKQTHGPATLATSNNSSGAGNGSGAASAGNHRCKYCDRCFVLERTLHIHLMEHCQKIPAAERRKLDFHEMDHVKKEETPHFRLPTATRLASNAKLTATSSTAIKDPLTNFPVNKRTLEQFKMQSNMRMAAGSDKQFIGEFRSKTANEQQAADVANTQSTRMAPPNATKVKKRGGLYTGVYRTPNKDIPCVPCKQNFKNVLDFTNHMMMTHATLDASMNSLGGHAE